MYLADGVRPDLRERAALHVEDPDVLGMTHVVQGDWMAAAPVAGLRNGARACGPAGSAPLVRGVRAELLVQLDHPREQMQIVADTPILLDLQLAKLTGAGYRRRLTRLCDLQSAFG